MGMNHMIEEYRKQSRIKTANQARDPGGPSICSITDSAALAKAGTSDLVALKPLPNNPPIVKELGVLEVLAGGIIAGELIHLHGETGTGKNAVLEALLYVPENWKALCRHLKANPLPLKAFPIEMAVFETISEVYSRRALRKGQTYDEPSAIVQALRECSRLAGKAYPLIWLREMGRVSAAAVQGGLLNLMSKGVIPLGNGEAISGQNIAWVADSNYHTDDTSTHVLVTQDDALKRRWTISIAFDYLSQEQEIEILRYHMKGGYLPEVGQERLFKIVELGHAIRRRRSEGALASLASPSIYGYSAFLRAVHRHPHFSPQEVCEFTLLGSSSQKDREEVRGLVADVFRLGASNRQESEGGELFES